MHSTVEDLKFDLIESCKESKLHGYYPSFYLRLLEEHGPLETAIMLIDNDNYSSGITKLYELEILHLSVEAIVLENKKYHSLFSEELLKKAKRKLENYGYKVNINE